MKTEYEKIAQRLEEIAKGCRDPDHEGATGYVVDATDAPYFEQVARLLRDSAERGWIPVSERLPDIGDRTLVIDSHDRINIGVWVSTGTGAICCEWPQVKKWMPLPESP